MFHPANAEFVRVKAFEVNAVAMLAVWFDIEPEVEPFPLNVTVA